MLPWRIVAPFNGTLVGVTTLPLQKELKVFSPAKPAHGLCVSSQSFLLVLDASSFRRAAAVVWDRRHILDQANVDSSGLESAQRRFSPRSRTTNKNLYASETVIHSLLRRAVRGLLRCEGSSFARSLEAHGTSARPRDDIALIVGNRYDRVVKRRMNVHHALGDILSPPSFARSLFAGLLVRLAFSLFLFFFCDVVRFCHNVS